MSSSDEENEQSGVPKTSTQSVRSKLLHLIHTNRLKVYDFQQASAADKDLLGFKGANLCELVRLNLPVPPGFIVGTDTCLEFMHADNELKYQIRQRIRSQCRKALQRIEKETDMMFDEPVGHMPLKMPLLLSVRSSAAAHMPGMMESVLNLGINDDIVEVMAKVSQNAHWAYDTYRRFLQMYGVVVRKVDRNLYEKILSDARALRGVEHDSDLSVEELKQVVVDFQVIQEVPQSPWRQLSDCIEAIFAAWYTPAAVKYRDVHGMGSGIGTAVVVQTMVYGNINDQCGAGLAMSRNPLTGVKEFGGKFLSNALGSDITDGVRTPQTLEEMGATHERVYADLRTATLTCEEHFKDAQKIDFTIQNGVLCVLAARSARRSAAAAVRMAVSMVSDKLITEREALMRIEPEHMEYFLHSTVDPSQDCRVHERIVGTGIGVSTGLAIGTVVFTVAQAKQCDAKEEQFVLCAAEEAANGSDIVKMKSCAGFIMIRGSRESQVARLARRLNKPAVVGVSDMRVDMDNQLLLGQEGTVFACTQGDVISIDGSSGLVYLGAVPCTAAGQDQHYLTVLRWADKYKRMHVRASVFCAEDVQKVQMSTAEGIGLFATEHLFQSPECLELVQTALLTSEQDVRNRSLQKLCDIHSEAYLRLFEMLKGAVLKIRLLDCPLSTFFPCDSAEEHNDMVAALCDKAGLTGPEEYQEKVMCLVGAAGLEAKGGAVFLLHSDLLAMQVTAITGAALEAKKRGFGLSLGLIVPHVCVSHEFDALSEALLAACETVCEEAQHSIKFIRMTVGAAVEVPRACLVAEKLVACEACEFVSFDLTALTETMLGFCQTDSSRYSYAYTGNKAILSHDPFLSLDEPAVGAILQVAVSKCKSADPNVVITAHGTQCADPKTIAFLDRLGVHSISCAPHHVPGAKVAAAQAKIKDDIEKELEESKHGDLWKFLNTLPDVLQ